MSKRTLVSPSGNRVEVADSKLQLALQSGYRYLTVKEEEQAADAASPGTAAAAGFLRGVTVGLSDPVFAGVDKLLQQATGRTPVRPVSQQLEGMRTENPGLSVAGEVVGNVAGLVAGPVKGVAAVGNKVRAAVGPGVKGAALAGAAEGTLYGLGTMISEATLGDPSLNAEKLAAVTGAGIFGAGLSAVTHGTGSALAKAFGGKTMQSMLDDVANAGLRAQLGSKKVMNARGLHGDEADKVFEYARKNGLVSAGDTVETFLDRVTKHREGIGAETGEVLRKASERTVRGLDGKDVQQPFIPDSTWTSKFADRVRKELLPELARSPGAKGVVSRIEGELESLQKGDWTVADAWKFQSELKKSIGYGEQSGVLKEGLGKFRSLLRDEIKTQANTVSPHFGAQLDDLSNKYRTAKSLEELGLEQVKRAEANGALGAKDLLAAAVIGGPGGIGAAVASKMARERGGFLVSAMADKIASSKSLQRMAGALKNSVQSLDTQGMLGAYRPVLMTAFARGEAALLAAHVQLAQTDPEYLPRMGMLAEEGDAANQYAEKAVALEAVGRAIEKHDYEVDAAAAKFLGKQPGAYAAASPSTPSMADLEKRLTRLTTALQNPETVDVSGLASTAPGLAMQTSIQAQNAAGFLLSKAPKNPNAGLPAFHQPWVVSQAELAKFYRYVDAAERPVDVLRNLAKNGSVTKEEVETLRTLYPRLIEDYKTKMMNRLLEYKEPLTYNQRRALGKLFGDGFAQTDPRRTALLQAMHAGSMNEQQNPPGRDGRQSQTQEDNLQTQAQRIENR